MSIVDSWRNASGEQVQLHDNGRLTVVTNTGQSVPGAALNAGRCDRASVPAGRGRSPAVAEQITAYEAEVQHHPGLIVNVNTETGEVAGAFLAPVPYWKAPAKKP